MNNIIELDISGIGIIIYSPWAVAHIEPNSDYLSSDYWEDVDVGNHVRNCSLTALAVGSSGRFRLHISTEPTDIAALQASEFRAALCLEVRDQIVCVRDLYDLMEWEPRCPQIQTFSIEDGFYHISAYTSTPSSGVLGDNQDLYLNFQQVPNKPEITWQGVPQLC